MNNQVQNLYAKTQVNTAHPGELTLMLYNGCIKFMKQAIKDTENKDFESKNYHIQRSVDIIDELQITLNMDYEISQNLFRLYTFVKEQLMEANIKLNKGSLESAIHFMSELRDAWAQALKEVKSNAKVSV
ncbi:flagellar export chaperone FliS [Ferviditalea candida]|uniref:Flagellar secretion chaperone FliS n=1 Tax=Ferviditalea candida TaxID=3108399 RepID=A0ABU5ZIL3_9BACL|nr:flagellar export chaperone FliS [Paenibacillaceae bacterium T2]